jgi:putative glycosyltransferase (TIGR04348 family)
MAHLFIVTPAAARSRNGNRNTAVRWQRLLRSAGHRVDVDVQWQGQATDLLLALHARRSHASITRYRMTHPHAPLALALTGTDLYRDIRHDADAQASLQLADRLIVLQEQAVQELAPPMRAKCRIIYQSAKPMLRAPPSRRRFEVAVIGHLRDEKDPFRAALAAGLLPAASRIRIVHMGRALSPELEQQARHWMAREPRYRWLEEVPAWQVRRRLIRMQALLVSSRMEGGANVVSEALAADVPVLASAVGGNIGMLGAHYEGYYPVEDEGALARLLYRFETDATFRDRLCAQCAARKPLIAEDRERAALAALVDELVQPAISRAGRP